jgi:beta-glucosidase/6-phospho-beta-glucosidase/beta-galactosidase
MNLMLLLPYHYRSALYPQPKEDLDTVVKGFAAFSKACAEHYKGKVKIWEK